MCICLFIAQSTRDECWLDFPRWCIATRHYLTFKGDTCLKPTLVFQGNTRYILRSSQISFSSKKFSVWTVNSIRTSFISHASLMLIQHKSHHLFYRCVISFNVKCIHKRLGLYGWNNNVMWDQTMPVINNTPKFILHRIHSINENIHLNLYKGTLLLDLNMAYFKGY